MAALYPRAAVPLAKLSKRDDLLSSPTLAPMAPPEIPDEPDFKALVAAATPLRDVTRSTTNVLTPWGYSIAKGEHKDSGKSSGGASWETIKAGLMSPPPMAAGLLSPPPNAVVEEAEGEEVADEATGEESEQPPEQTTTTAMAPAPAGRGGWLVDLVEGWSVSDASPAEASPNVNGIVEVSLLSPTPPMPAPPPVRPGCTSVELDSP